MQWAFDVVDNGAFDVVDNGLRHLITWEGTLQMISSKCD